MTTATNHLLDALRLLALSAGEQLECFPSFVVVSDEMALLFDDQYRRWNPTGGGAELRARLEQIDGLLEEMGNDQNLWSESALRKSAEWSKIRKIAKNALELVGEDVRVPNLDWVSYVEG